MSCMSKLCILGTGICPCDSTCTVCRKGTVYMYRYQLFCLVMCKCTKATYMMETLSHRIAKDLPQEVIFKGFFSV